MSTNLSDHTKVPIGWIIGIVVGVGVCISPLVGAVMWATTVANNASDAKAEVNGIRPTLRDIDVRLIRIEEYLKKREED